MIDDPILVLVDYQRNFCDPACNAKLASDDDAAASVRSAIERTDRFLHRYRSSGRTPVIVRTIHDEFVRPDRRQSGNGPGPCLPGSEAAQFAEGFDITDSDIVVTKHRYNPFYGTDLDVYLSANDVSKMLIGGVNTHICVFVTAIAAVDRDYHVEVLSDCVAASSTPSHREGLHILSTIADDVKPSEDVSL